MKRVYFILIFTLTSCYHSQVTIPIVKPAKINLAKYDNIAVGEILDNRFNRDLELENLIKHNLIQFSGLNLLDERYLQSVIWNSKYNTANKNDSILASTVLVSASIIDMDFNSSTEFIKEIVEIKKKDTVIKKEYKITSEFDLKLSFNITDINSGVIIYNNSFKEFFNDSEKYFDNYVPVINKKSVFERMKQRIVDRFFRDILPTKTNVRVYFKDYKGMYSVGIQYARQGLLDKAKEYFEMQVKYQNENRKISWAYYNLGLCNMYLYDFDNAYYCFEQAETYMHDVDNYNMIVKCQQLEADFLVLQEQMRD